MRIFDCFLYNGEKDLLDIRVNELSQLDCKVIHLAVLSSFTFSGQLQAIPDHNIETGVDFWLAKNPPNNGNPWDNETYQRNKIKESLLRYDPQDDDIVIISDIDEIPSAYAIAQYRSEYGMCALQQDMYYYYLNVLDSRQSWRFARIMPWSYLKDKEPDSVRRSGFNLCLMNAGWHFTYMGGVDKMLEKFKAFSHQEEAVQKLASEEILKEKLSNLESLWSEEKLTPLPIDDTMPLYVRMNQDKFKHMIYVP